VPQAPDSTAGPLAARGLFGGGIAILSAKGLGRAGQFGSQVLLARILGASSFGSFAVAFSIMRFIELLSALGLDLAVLRLGAEADRASTGPGRSKVLAGSLHLVVGFGGLATSGMRAVAADW